MANKRILYISYDGMTDPLGQSQVLPYLRGLSKLGYRFTLISCEKPELLKTGQSTIENICRENEIDWHPLPYTKKPPVISTIIDLRRIIRHSKNILSKCPHDILHCRGHYITSLAAMSLLKKYPMKYIFDMRGFWADERVDGGLWPVSHPIYGTIYTYFKRKEVLFLEKSDHIITLTESAKEILRSWGHIKKQPLPIDVIPCCADLEYFNYNRFNEADILTFREKLNIGKGLIVGYLGSLGTWYMLEEMVLMYKAILQVRPDSYFLVVTNDYPESIAQLLLKHGIPSSGVVIKNATRQEVPAYLSLFQIGLFFIRPTLSKKGSSPVKHGEMMGMGIPLICNSGIGDVDSIVQNTRSGIVVKGFTKDQMDEAAAKLDDLLAIPKEDIRNAAFSIYDLETGVKKYADIYTKVFPDGF